MWHRRIGEEPTVDPQAEREDRERLRERFFAFLSAVEEVRQLARELPELDELGWKCLLKLHVGVPILRAEDEEFRSKYDSVVMPMEYEKKLTIMEFWPVTSIMTISQLSMFLEKVKSEIYRMRLVRLEFPDNTKVKI